jgi:hypothetical protein
MLEALNLVERVDVPGDEGLPEPVVEASDRGGVLIDDCQQIDLVGGAV